MKAVCRTRIVDQKEAGAGTPEPRHLEQNSSVDMSNRAGEPITLSVVIPVRDRWAELDDCLAALAQQNSPPPFEVIVVDDGSQEAMPEPLAGTEFPFPMVIEQKPATGISAARNSGIDLARGDIVVFIDSDCLAGSRFLHAVREAADRFPIDIGFQANLRGCDDNIVGTMEGLRLETIIDLKRTADGHLHYLNTSGFAIRRSYSPATGRVFDESVQRGEDSLLLADLLALNAAPRLVEAGIVQHVPRLGLLAYISKHFYIGYQTDRAQTRLSKASQGRLDNAGRRRMFAAMRQKAHARRYGWLALILIVVAYSVERLGRMASQSRPDRR